MKRKMISLSEATYNRLDRFRGKRESFDQAVERLLTLLDRVGELRTVLEGQIEYAEFKRKQLEKQAAAVGQRDSKALPDVPAH